MDIWDPDVHSDYKTEGLGWEGLYLLYNVGVD